MRYAPHHKQETRDRVVRAASRHFRAQGGKGVAIADLMRKLDLTHGGFYRHFRSKEELLAEAVAKGFEDSAARFTEVVEKAPAGGELRAIVETYLSLEHCSNPADGCPLAAMGSELAHYPRSVRAKIDRAMREHASKIAKHLPGATKIKRERNCLLLFSGMAGALSVARATANPERRKDILQSAKEFYIKAFSQ